jgi:protein-tyrosine phosphatase
MPDDTIDIMFFCLGNICRSPLAEAVFSHEIEEAGLEDAVRIESSGTSSYHVGEEPDPGSQKVARERLGRDISHQRSQQLTEGHLKSFDYLVAMSDSNRTRALQQIDEAPDELHLMRDFEPNEGERGLDVPDPYGSGQNQFELVYQIIDRCCDEFLDYLQEQHPELA